MLLHQLYGPKQGGYPPPPALTAPVSVLGGVSQCTTAPYQAVDPRGWGGASFPCSEAYRADVRWPWGGIWRGQRVLLNPVWLQGKLLITTPPPHLLWAEAPLGDPPQHSHPQDSPTMPVPAAAWGDHSALQPPIASTSVSPHSPPRAQVNPINSHRFPRPHRPLRNTLAHNSCPTPEPQTAHGSPTALHSLPPTHHSFSVLTPSLSPLTPLKQHP